MPTIPRPTITATTIRTTLRALLAGGGGATGAVEGTATLEAPTGAPHLLQNCAPSLRVAPQELQNAMVHLGAGILLAWPRVYRRLSISGAKARFHRRGR